MIYRNIITEPRWKSYIVLGDNPVFSKEECEKIIEVGKSLPKKEAVTGFGKKEKNINYEKRHTDIAWIPFEKMPNMYKTVLEWGLRFNNNFFGFDGLQLVEQAQFTQYSQSHHYGWHSDSAYDMANEPFVRKLTMGILLNDPKDFTGGEFQIIDENKTFSLKQGHAIFFASFIAHRVLPVKTGTRVSLQTWFNGPPLK